MFRLYDTDGNGFLDNNVSFSIILSLLSSCQTAVKKWEHTSLEREEEQICFDLLQFGGNKSSSREQIRV